MKKAILVFRLTLYSREGKQRYEFRNVDIRFARGGVTPERVAAAKREANLASDWELHVINRLYG